VPPVGDHGTPGPKPSFLEDSMALLDGGEIRDGLLTVQIVRNGNACAVALVGELDLSNAPTAELALRGLLDDHAARIVVDLRQLTFIDSTGIAMFVQLIHEDEKFDRFRFLPSPSPAVTRVLEITGVDKQLSITGDSDTPPPV